MSKTEYPASVPAFAEPPAQTPLRKKILAGMALFFLLLLAANALLTLAGASWFDHFLERRVLAPFPDFTNKPFSVAAFTRGFDEYIADHYAFRKPLAIALNSVKYHVFHSSPSSEVMLGREGWAFSSGKRLIDETRSNWKFRPDAQYIRDIEAFIAGTADWLERRGIMFLFILAPEKSIIYPWYLPEAIGETPGISAGEALTRRLIRKFPKNVVNVFSPLHRKAAGAQLYYRMDPHWNHMGAKIAVDEAAAVMKRNFPRLGAPDFPEMELKDTSTAWLAFCRMMAAPMTETEKVPMPVTGWRSVRKPFQPLQNLLPPKGKGSLRTNPHLPPGKILIIGDSFANRIIEYMAELFAETYMVNLWETDYIDPANRFPFKLINAVRPDVVVVLFVEGRLKPCNEPWTDYMFNPAIPGLAASAAGRGVKTERER